MSATAEATLVYAVDLRNGRFVTFDTLAPGTQNVLATSYTGGYYGLDFDASATNLYGAKGSSTVTPTLERLNLADGSVASSTPITGLDAGGTVTGLTIDNANNAYLSASGTAGYNLYNLNLGTGAASLIGTMSATNIVIDIATDVNGRMVAHDISTDSFWFVNTSSAAMTLIGSHGLAANFAQGMDFDWSNNTLYAAVYTGGGTLTYGSVSLADGSVTSIPGIVSGEYEMAVQSPVPEPASIMALSLGALALLRRRKR
ncbi:MAG: PEP-CTERM sorting domain-containing protein [Fimbriimonadaceae bacterium]|nr:PEP-CTERM sorting domain-containing protein [Fimbriimonadaceae bacterium]